MNKVLATFCIFFIFSCTKTQEPLLIPDLMPRSGDPNSAEFKKAEETVIKLRGDIKAHPEVLKNYTNLAQVFMQEARVTGRHHEYYPISDRLIEEALLRDSLYFDALFLKASNQMTKHRFADAKQTITKAISVNGDNAGAYGVLADANTELGLYDDATKALEQMQNKRPDLRLYSRASYQRELHGDLEGALTYMRAAVDAGAFGQESREWSVYQYANLYLQSGRADTAQFLYNGILEERPDYGYALSGLAMVAAKKGDYPTAIEHLVKASQVLPEHLFIEQLSDIYIAMGDKANAKPIEEKVLQTFDQHEKDGWNTGREYAFYCANHDIHLTEALQKAEEDYKSRPENVDALDTYAWTLYKNNRAVEAKPLIEKAMRLNTINTNILYHASLIEVATGNATMAQQLRDRCAYLSPINTMKTIAAY